VDFLTSTHNQAEVSGKKQYNVVAATIIPELATNANPWELQGSGLHFAFEILESFSVVSFGIIG
jgi:hypothetical protein